jgi:hypothetical protein
MQFVTFIDLFIGIIYSLDIQEINVAYIYKCLSISKFMFLCISNLCVRVSCVEAFVSVSVFVFMRVV